MSTKISEFDPDDTLSDAKFLVLAGDGSNAKITGENLKLSVLDSMEGDVTCNDAGVTAIDTGVIVDADVNGSAAIAHSKLADMSTGKLLGRSSGGSGAIQEITCTSAGRDLLADAAASDQLTTLGALPLAGGAMTGAITTDSTFDGVDIAVRDGILTSTTTTAGAALPKAGGTMSGELVCADELVTRPELKDYAETVNVIGGTGGGTVIIDLEDGNVITATVDTTDNTFQFDSPSVTGKACSFTLILTNGGSETVNWPGTVTWPGGSAPTLTASGVDILTFSTVDAGSTWYGFMAGATAPDIVGLQDMWIPAAAMTVSVDGPAAAIASIDSGSNNITIPSLAFQNTTADQFATFNVAFPKSWNAGTITAQFFWTNTSGTTGSNVVWGIQGLCFVNDADLDGSAFPTGVVAISPTEDDGDLVISPATAAVTITNAADAGLTFFNVYRDQDHVSDAYGANAHLIGVKINYTTDALNDA